MVIQLKHDNRRMQRYNYQREWGIICPIILKSVVFTTFTSFKIVKRERVPLRLVYCKYWSSLRLCMRLVSHLLITNENNTWDRFSEWVQTSKSMRGWNGFSETAQPKDLCSEYSLRTGVCWVSKSLPVLLSSPWLQTYACLWPRGRACLRECESESSWTSRIGRNSLKTFFFL